MLKKYHRPIDSLTEIVYNSIRGTIDFFSRFTHINGRNNCLLLKKLIFRRYNCDVTDKQSECYQVG